ncbi:hypothetical protein ACFOTA_20495 [Chitinophaga sp. GCM10012297]|uniref:Uncharacterized protein n=1 Tax=Chitinophaga chungangae TaxID=2821488 RepID=A0ABS3YIV2_9BACT|nr:hypothetical protein [Chitinophaga chungangae]MBO9154605.1 hypothetical protein [Chitinophaga chungangae]
MKKLIHSIGAIILLGVFCLYITPRDYVHHFTGHEDTVDQPVSASCSAPDGPGFSQEHRHCEWLNWVVDAYLPAHEVHLPATAISYADPVQGLPAYIFSSPAYFFSLRAPPHAC